MAGGGSPTRKLQRVFQAEMSLFILLSQWPRDRSCVPSLSPLALRHLCQAAFHGGWVLTLSAPPRTAASSSSSLLARTETPALEPLCRCKDHSPSR